MFCFELVLTEMWCIEKGKSCLKFANIPAVEETLSKRSEAVVDLDLPVNSRSCGTDGVIFF